MARNLQSDNYYERLDVKPDASDKDIRKAYLAASVIEHPDKNGGSPESKANFIKLDEAYKKLSDPAERAAHDEKLRKQTSIQPSAPPGKETPTVATPPAQEASATPTPSTKGAEESKPASPSPSPSEPKGGMKKGNGKSWQEILGEFAEYLTSKDSIRGVVEDLVNPLFKKAAGAIKEGALSGLDNLQKWWAGKGDNAGPEKPQGADSSASNSVKPDGVAALTDAKPEAPKLVAALMDAPKPEGPELVGAAGSASNVSASVAVGAVAGPVGDVTSALGSLPDDAADQTLTASPESAAEAPSPLSAAPDSDGAKIDAALDEVIESPVPKQ